MSAIVRKRFREYTEMERDQQRIAIRRFFAILKETNEEKGRQGASLWMILKMYKFKQDDLIEFIKVMDDLKKVHWVSRRLNGSEEQAQGL